MVTKEIPEVKVTEEKPKEKEIKAIPQVKATTKKQKG